MSPVWRGQRTLRGEARLARALAGFFAFAICNLLGALKAASTNECGSDAAAQVQTSLYLPVCLRRSTDARSPPTVCGTIRLMLGLTGPAPELEEW